LPRIIFGEEIRDMTLHNLLQKLNAAMCRKDDAQVQRLEVRIKSRRQALKHRPQEREISAIGGMWV
jgi:hypothetical protein